MDITKFSWEERDAYEEEVLRKIRNKEDFTDEELSTFFDMLVEVDCEEYEDNRWTRSIDTIFKVKNSYVLLPWEKGLTEYQENEFNDEPYEVYYIETKIIKKIWKPKEIV